MSKAHKITQLKKRIAVLEKMLKEIPSLEQRFAQRQSEIVELTNVSQFDLGRMRFAPTEKEILGRAIGEMFNIWEHPEIAQLFTCTEYVGRVSPMFPDSEIHAYEVKCKIVKPE